eukprot:CAMPEP_0197623502 /NCGR_PEP_ID=MMETSP1338-20131121/3500_1 /TAXON_ID=43686 ORGANISM="Pelagodinium beii, Strain RCC1491" /NCGR_SAMPLE_ID=MMETSP1338 /ASSEMBLY_ACC=CAM_ASM_000754 /LENGTH=30 /DNA_ID= /DNA_START= /DNA_END= /DNA_ORIENTATION=
MAGAGSMAYSASSTMRRIVVTVSTGNLPMA